MRIDSHLTSWLGAGYMATLREAVNAAAKASFCTLSAPLDRTIGLGENFYDNANFPGLPPGPTAAGQALRTARNLFCNEQPDDSSAGFIQPFIGGQCPGTIYQASADVSINGGAPVFAGQGSGPGPLVRDRGPNDPTGERDVIRDANGDLLTGGGTSAPGGTYQLVNIVITPISGPDDCGDPQEQPAEPYRETDFTDTPNVTYTPDSGPDITIPVPLVFAPVTLNNDLQIEVPVTANFGGNIDIRGTLNLDTGDVNFNTRNEINNPTTVEDPTVSPDPTGIPGDPETTEESLEKSIIGVYVRTTLVEPPFPGNERPTSAAGTLFYIPRLGIVTFHCELLSAPGLGWTVDVDIKYTSEVVMCPVPWGAKSVSITEQPGVTMEVTLIRAESQRELLLRAAGVS